MFLTSIKIKNLNLTKEKIEIYSAGLHSGAGFSSIKYERCTAFSSIFICLIFNVRNKFNFSSSRLTIELNVGILNSL